MTHHQRRQVDLNVCTIGLEPGTTKNDDGRITYLTPEFVKMLRAQDDRIQVLEIRTGRPYPAPLPLPGRTAPRAAVL